MGPIIPFLSKDRDKPETEYSSLFVARTVGAVLAFLTTKYLHKNKIYLCEHKIIAYNGVINGIFMIVFIKWNTGVGEFISFAVFGAGHYAVLRSINICLLENSKANAWIPMTHAMFGVGALASPLLINLLNMEVYYIMAFFCAVFSLLCLYLPPSVPKYPEGLLPTLT
jgi:hypothetical protein